MIFFWRFLIISDVKVSLGFFFICIDWQNQFVNPLSKLDDPYCLGSVCAASLATEYKTTRWQERVGTTRRHGSINNRELRISLIIWRHFWQAPNCLLTLSNLKPCVNEEYWKIEVLSDFYFVYLSDYWFLEVNKKIKLFYYY